MSMHIGHSPEYISRYPELSILTEIHFIHSKANRGSLLLHHQVPLEMQTYWQGRGSPAMLLCRCDGQINVHQTAQIKEALWYREPQSCGGQLSCLPQLLSWPLSSLLCGQREKSGEPIACPGKSPCPLLCFVVSIAVCVVSCRAPWS